MSWKLINGGSFGCGDGVFVDTHGAKVGSDWEAGSLRRGRVQTQLKENQRQKATLRSSTPRLSLLSRGARSSRGNVSVNVIIASNEKQRKTPAAATHTCP